MVPLIVLNKGPKGTKVKPMSIVCDLKMFLLVLILYSTN